MSASIRSITESDFAVLARAAQAAKERGDTADADELDKLARKASASLTNTKYAGAMRFASSNVKTLKWSSVPSTLL